MDTKKKKMLKHSTLILLTFLVVTLALGFSYASTPISSCLDLNNVRNDLTADYHLTQNIDCIDTINWNGGEGFVPIRNGITYDYYNGTFDGNNFAITNLYEKRTGFSPQGLTSADLFFGMDENATVKNLQLLDFNLMGYAHCSALGIVTGATIENIYATGTIACESDPSGGIVSQFQYGLIQNVYADVNFRGGGSNVGGIVGLMNNSNAYLYNAYSKGRIFSGSNYSGGAIGRMSNGLAENVFSVLQNDITGANHGGFVGRIDAGTITNSFWDINATTHTGGYGTDGGASIDLTGTTWEDDGTDYYYLQANEPLASWDFNADLWKQITNDLPVLFIDYLLTTNYSTTFDQLNNKVYLYDASTTFGAITLDTWTWKKDGLTFSTDQNTFFSSSGSQDYNICLTVTGTSDEPASYNNTLCSNVETWNSNTPTLIYDTNHSVGFSTDFDVNYSFTCADDDTTINYLMQKNDGINTTTIYDANITQGTEITGTETLDTEATTYVFTCTDPWGNLTTETAPTIYALGFNLINEQTGAIITDLNTIDVASLTAFTYDGNNSYDYNIYNPGTQFFIDTDNVLRFDITYNDVGELTFSREIDFGILPDTNIGLCIAPLQDFYEQLIVSSRNKDVVIYNDFAKCYNLASSTKFAYDTALMTRAFTINKPYYLYTWINDVKTLLSTLDGSKENTINLDVLEFNQRDYDFEIATDTLVFKCLENTSTGICDQNTMVIYYKSLRGDNATVNLKIYRNTTLLWQYTEESEPNEFNVNFYYGDIDLNITDILKLELTKTNTAGTETTIDRWFNLEGQTYSGTMDASLAIVFSFMLLFVGLTLVAYRYAMGWFGVILCFIAIGILSFAPGFWYVQFMQVVITIVAVFIMIIFSRQNGVLN